MSTDAEIDRRELLPELFPAPGKYLLVSGLAGASRDAAALTGDSDRLFTLAGVMGAAVPLGLGMALSAPDSQVAAITGDGELLMDLGALATVATQAPGNFSIVCIDNGRHGETGGQLSHTSRRTDLARIAEGAGLASVLAISRPGEIPAAANFLTDATAPRFLLVRVKPGPPSAYKRNLDPAACRLRFRNAYLDAG